MPELESWAHSIPLTPMVVDGNQPSPDGETGYTILTGLDTNLSSGVRVHVFTSFIHCSAADATTICCTFIAANDKRGLLATCLKIMLSSGTKHVEHVCRGARQVSD